MGKVMQTIKLDEQLRRRGRHPGVDPPPTKVRTTEIEALVDTGATMLVLPADAVSQLGLLPAGYRKVRYADGRSHEVPWVSGIRIDHPRPETLVDESDQLGREAIINALVEAAGTTPLIGQIPLEELDLLVDPKSRELRVNPASPDAPLLDLLSAA